jgi:hypothetical protein
VKVGVSCSESVLLYGDRYEGLPPNIKKQCEGLTALHVGAPHHGMRNRDGLLCPLAFIYPAFISAMIVPRGNVQRQKRRKLPFAIHQLYTSFISQVSGRASTQSYAPTLRRAAQR